MTLPELSAAATQGEWRVNKVAATHVENHKSRGTAACGGYSDNYSDGRFHSENEANAAFIVALVNAYRSGQLVERDGVAGGRFEVAYREYSDKLGWLQGNRNLPVCYLGWHVADAATDMLKRAYPELALTAIKGGGDAD